MKLPPKKGEVWANQDQGRRVLVKQVLDSTANLLDVHRQISYWQNVDDFMIEFEPYSGMTAKQERAVVRVFRRYWLGDSMTENLLILKGVLAVLNRNAVKQVLRHAETPFPPGL
jgi:hypothetical protein